jgi:transcriptional regulator with XRE-family HTH domain
MLDDATTTPLRAARLRARLTQIDLARQAQVSLSTLRVAERGIATDRTLERLAAALGVPAAELRL